MGQGTYGSVLRERWRIVIAGALVGGLVAAVLLAVLPPRFTSQSTVLLATTSPPGDVTAAYDGAMLAQQQVQAYLPLLEGEQFASAVNEQLARRGITEDPTAIESAVDVVAAGETPVLVLTATAPTPQAAQARAAAAADAAAAMIVAVAQGPGDTPPTLVARVVGAATVPGSPSPGWLPLVLVGVLAGLALGVMGALVRNAVDRSVRTPEEVERSARAPLLGALDEDRHHERHPLALHQGPRSDRAESIGAIRAALALRRNAPRREVLLVTSPLPGEGKTSVACDLAIAAAQGGRRVLLVGADLRRPRFGSFLGIEEAVGLSTLIEGRVNRPAAVQRWGGGLLDVLPSGRVPARPADAIASPRLPALVADLRRSYDLVVLDTPPVLAVADATVLARIADGCVLVVARGRSSGQDVEEAALRLRSGGTVVGTILSRARRGTRPRYRPDPGASEVSVPDGAGPDRRRGPVPETETSSPTTVELAGLGADSRLRSGRVEGEPRTVAVSAAALARAASGAEAFQEPRPRYRAMTSADPGTAAAVDVVVADAAPAEPVLTTAGAEEGDEASSMVAGGEVVAGPDAASDASTGDAAPPAPQASSSAAGAEEGSR